METSTYFSIGTLARSAGVSVQTLRHYDAKGLLRPSYVSDAGYRMYTSADQSRLHVVRALRALDIDLDTIARMLDGQVEVRNVAQLQLESIELQLRALKRQQAVLRTTLALPGDLTPDMLARIQALAHLDRLEREMFVAGRLERSMHDVPIDPSWKAWWWQLAVLDTPEDLSAEQLEAWLELAELVASDGFLAAVERQAVSFWTETGEGFDFTTWNQGMQDLFAQGEAAMQRGQHPHDEQAKDLVHDWVALYARVMDRDNDPAFPAALLAMLEQNQDQRVARFWELVGVLKPEVAASAVPQVFLWLRDGLRWRVAYQDGEADAPT